MDIIKTEIPGVIILEPKRFGDARGFFMEFYHTERYAAAGIPGPFVQDNFSRSSRGVLRGLHLQYPNPQGKLISVVSGRILDVLVDVRRGSPTFGKHVAAELSGENGRQIFGPRGMAHGFLVLSEQADIFYKCDGFFSPADEIALAWNDPALGIDWPTKAPQLSARDTKALKLSEIAQLPPYEP